MRNLLSANFARLWRSRLFWIAEAGVYAWGVFAYFLLRVNSANGYPFENGNTYFFNQMTFVGITMACFSGLFIGTEYSDGAMGKDLSGKSGHNPVCRSGAVCSLHTGGTDSRNTSGRRSGMEQAVQTGGDVCDCLSVNLYERGNCRIDFHSGAG